MNVVQMGEMKMQDDRLDPLDVFKLSMNFYFAQAKLEIEKGKEGSITLIVEYLQKAQESASLLAPYVNV